MTRDVPAPTSLDDSSAWASIAVRYADRPTAMPLLRLDRQGLTVAIVDEADPPTLGLPRRAQIVFDSTPLCELRLVARAANREHEHAMTLTLQPSRADDHALLWQALCAHRTAWAGSISDEGSGHTLRFNPSAVEWRPADARGGKAESSAASAIHLRDAVSCDAVFSLANHEDAWLFSRWLDYYFAEVRARARMSGAAADLRDLCIRVVDHEVEVRFLYQSTEQVVQTSTEMACRWITSEAGRQLDMTVEHWLSGAVTAGGSPYGRPVKAVMGSGVRRC